MYVCWVGGGGEVGKEDRALVGSNLPVFRRCVRRRFIEVDVPRVGDGGWRGGPAEAKEGFKGWFRKRDITDD